MLRVGDAVFVIVFVRTAIRVFEAVFVFGDVRAMVDLVGNTVLVVVFVGTAISVLEAIFVLGDVRTLIHFVQDTVVIAIAHGVRIQARAEVVHQVHAEQEDVRVLGTKLTIGLKHVHQGEHWADRLLAPVIQEIVANLCVEHAARETVG